MAKRKSTKKKGRKKVAKRGRKRKKGGRKRARTRTRSRGGKKPIRRGLLGKAGAVIMGGGPLVISGLDAAASAMNNKKSRGMTGLSAIEFGAMRFLNDMGQGIIGWMPFKKGKGFALENGQSVVIEVGAGVEPGALAAVMLTGGVMMGADAAASFFTGNRAVMIPGTHIAATGSR